MGGENPFRQTAAYTIFLEELRDQLLEVQDLQSKGKWSDQEYEVVRERFHKVQGSAGLFGHDDLGEIALQIEQKLQSTRLPLSALTEDLNNFVATSKRIARAEEFSRE